MNQAERCHQIGGCPGLYVDAFKAFRPNTRDPSCAFILTHYHGDHYNGLPKDGAYKGPAIIHCTPVTATLLRDVHGVQNEFIAEHPYGITWNFHIGKSGCDGLYANVTFYDANHCPGAAIVFVALPDGKTHLHTGDMRYHEKMKRYALLKEASERRNLDLLYLDTTYSHPKHDFVPQDVAVESIVSQVEDLLCGATAAKQCQATEFTDSRSDATAPASSPTLVLLSCYSIGKEKVLWEVSQRVDQLVYVNEKKSKMLQCIQGHKDVEESSAIIERCTNDADKSDIHVIPMGLAGEMWPYFRPNFNACANYASELEKGYSRVVAFMPTGWANGSNWNKKNATSQRRVELTNDNTSQVEVGGGKGSPRFIDVEIRLISYSEHSAFTELCAFIEFLKPRKVIPTVFSNEKEYITIEGRFKDLVDSKRAKQMFVNSMKGPSNNRTRHEQANGDDYCMDGATKECILQKKEAQNTEVIAIDSDHDESLERTPSKRRKSADDCDDAKVATLISMGFGRSPCMAALQRCGGDMERAIEVLIGSSSVGAPDTCATAASSPSCSIGNGTLKSSSPSSNAKRKRSGPMITQFFAPKKTG